jgi:hypothetical protein
VFAPPAPPQFPEAPCQQPRSTMQFPWPPHTLLAWPLCLWPLVLSCRPFLPPLPFLPLPPLPFLPLPPYPYPFTNPPYPFTNPPYPYQPPLPLPTPLTLTLATLSTPLPFLPPLAFQHQPTPVPFPFPFFLSNIFLHISHYRPSGSNPVLCEVSPNR